MFSDSVPRKFAQIFLKRTLPTTSGVSNDLKLPERLFSFLLFLPLTYKWSLPGQPLPQPSGFLTGERQGAEPLECTADVPLAFVNSPSLPFSLTNPSLFFSSLTFNLFFLSSSFHIFFSLFPLDFPTQSFTFIAHLIAPFLITGKCPRQKHSVTGEKKYVASSACIIPSR